MKKILIVEDDNNINTLLCDLLCNKYLVKGAYAGSEAKSILENETYDLVLLDLMLPGLTGEQLIKIIRETSQIPIIVITAKADVNVLVDVLQIGANDYISKPFNTKEVLARVEKQLATNQSSEYTKNLKIGRLRLDENTYQIYIGSDALVLTQKEYEILKLFMTHPNRVFTKANLYEQIWNDTYYGDDNTISVHISRLRNKLKDNNHNDIIETIWGVGFKLKI